MIRKVSAEDVAIRVNGTGLEYMCPTRHFVYIFFNPVFQVSTAKNEINLFNNHILIEAPVTFAPAGAMTPSAEFLFFFLFFFFFFVVCWISPDSGNSIPASTKCRVFEVFEQDTLSSYLSIGFYPGRRCLERPWRHMTILCEDAFPPMLGLYVRLFYPLNKLRSWFCISNVEETKTEHFIWKRKFWRLLYKQ